MVVRAGCILIVCALAGFFQPGFVSAAERDLPQVDLSLYAADPVPLQPSECGQCHTSQYGSLRTAGGKHRFACQQCHEVFHAYNPRKNNYDDLMPVCSSCHEPPHGPLHVDCLNCHRNPHAPRQVPAVDRLAQSCADCHARQANEMAEFPSAHKEQPCQSCHHEKHGYKPNCFECHDGHYVDQPVQDCMTCHQRVHAPLMIVFPDNAKVKTCNQCHDGIYAKWQGTPSKHGKVLCVMCHQEHGKIPDCRDCHGEPHTKQRSEMFPDCLTCHIDVHDLPVKKK